MTTANRSARFKPSRSTASAKRRPGWIDLEARLQQILVALRDDGTADPIDSLEQIAQLIYLKLLDEREPTSGSTIFQGLRARFRWSRFRDKRGVELQRFIGDEVLPYLASLVNEAPAIADYYRDATLKIEASSLLEAIVDAIDGIDFWKLEPDEMGRVLEYLLAQTSPSAEFRTPLHLRALMITLVAPGRDETIYDPACGTGGLLTDAVTYLLARQSSAPREVPIYGEDWIAGTGLTLEQAKDRYPLQTWQKEGGKQGLKRKTLGRCIYGNDISRRMVRIARMNLELQGIGPVNVRRANALSRSGGLSPDEMAQKHDVIVCATAFGDAPSREAIRTDLPVTSTRQELLFLEVAMSSLSPGGRCAIIVPDSLLFGEGSTYIEVRRRLLSAYEVLAVISLPSAAFRPHSSAKKSILVFRRPHAPRRGTRGVWFYEIEHDGYDLDQRPRPEKNDIPDLLGCWRSFAESGYKRPPGPEARSVADNKVGLHCWWARIGVITANRFDLSAHRYKPRPAMLDSIDTRLQLDGLRDAQASFNSSVTAITSQLDRVAFLRGWNERVGHAKLGDLVEIVSGKTPTIGEAAYSGGTIPWASPKDMKQHVLHTTKDHLTQHAIDDLALQLVEPPAVLIVVRGMILTRRVPIAVTAVPMAISRDLRALRPLPESGLDAWYLFAYLKSIESSLLASTFGTAHGSRSLPPRIILDFEVPIPPIGVREQLGRIMEAYVTLADATDKIMPFVQEVFPALLADIFGQRGQRQGDGAVRSDERDE